MGTGAEGKRGEGKNRKRVEVSERQVERRGGKEIGVKRVTRSRKRGKEDEKKREKGKGGR
jgi:hypothetical protein